MDDRRHTMRWVGRGCALAALVLGWGFIAWQNHFHLTAPMVFVALAYFAVVATIYNLWRTGVAVVDSDDDGDSTWAKPAGALGELEREKRTLLKAIKEAEFDHQMGKLSKRDADEMIRVYRARAIEVIKDIDRLGAGAAGSARDQILREVRARIELEAKTPAKKGADLKAKGGKARKQAAAESAKPAGAPAPQDEAAGAGEAAPAMNGSDPAPAPAEGDAAAAADAAAQRDRAPAARPTLDDEAMDADSTTTVEPAHDGPAKEATP
jgi:hypothetical protein